MFFIDFASLKFFLSVYEVIDVHILRSSDNDWVDLRVREPLFLCVELLFNSSHLVERHRRWRLSIRCYSAERASDIIRSFLHVLKHLEFVFHCNRFENRIVVCSLSSFRHFVVGHQVRSLSCLGLSYKTSRSFIHFIKALSLWVVVDLRVSY